MQVSYDEGVAIHIGPESCAVAREGFGEALTGGRIGQPLSRESQVTPGADAVERAEGNTYGRDSASVHMARRGRRPWHVQTLRVSGNRESSRSTARSKAAGPHREGEEP